MASSAQNQHYEENEITTFLPDNYTNRDDHGDRALSSSSTVSLFSQDLQTASQVSKSTIRRLYISHFLSYWNSRVFEFGSVLFLASIFPGTILPLSVYALARGIAAVIFSPVVGRYIDVGERLQVVRLSIVLQRLVVALSCIAFWFLTVSWVRHAHAIKYALFTLVCGLAGVEKLASVMNTISVERDWVVVIARGDEQLLGVLNSQMRRIDLSCKLLGPLFIGLIDGKSTKLAIIVTFGMTLASVAIEYYAIASVYHLTPDLKKVSLDANCESPRQSTILSLQSLSYLRKSIQASSRSLRLYFNHRAFTPSFACALLYCTVLSFAGQMVTYLISVGYTSVHVAAARTISVAFEISATWLAPWLMSIIGPVRTGMWFISWQIICLVVGVACFWKISSAPMVAALALMAATILSRIGLWGFDLSTQIIVQEEVESDDRGSFSSIEASLQNSFELCSYISTIIFSQPEQFGWPVLVSVAATCTAGGMYAAFVRRRRGHLVHLSACVNLKN